MFNLIVIKYILYMQVLINFPILAHLQKANDIRENEFRTMQHEAEQALPGRSALADQHAYAALAHVRQPAYFWV